MSHVLSTDANGAAGGVPTHDLLDRELLDQACTRNDRAYRSAPATGNRRSRLA
jgi:hypothetical protein